MYKNSTKLFIIALSIFILSFCQNTFSETPDSNIMELSIEQLMKVKIDSGTLTGSNRRIVPANVTTISSDDIESSGARSIQELLEIYVPGVQILNHDYEAPILGFRGVISDRQNKYLLIINGRVLNEQTHAGGIAELDLVMLKDILEINVVRGPAAAVYGAGALIGVIDIKIKDGSNFQGTESTTKVGAGNEFYSSELQFGEKIGNDSSLYLYGGVANQNGADNSAAPYISSRDGDGTVAGGAVLTAGERNPLVPTKYGSAFQGQTQAKFHADFTSRDWKTWARFSRGGINTDLDDRALSGGPTGWPWFQGIYPTLGDATTPGVGYQVLALQTENTDKISDSLKLNSSIGFHQQDYIRTAAFGFLDNHREDIYRGKSILYWTPSEEHSLAGGIEIEHGQYGLESHAFSNTGSLSGIFGGAYPSQWSTDTFSGMLEHHWTINDQWNLFSDIRIDKNTYTSPMYSPRIASVWTPTDKDTCKIIASRSSKMNFAEELRQSEITGTKSKNETLKSIDFAYNRQQTKDLSIGVNPFFSSYDLIGYSNADKKSEPVGNLKLFGVDFETAYKINNVKLTAIHSVSKMTDFTTDLSSQYVSAKPYGFGSNVIYNVNNLTKFIVEYQPTDRWNLNSSLRIGWGSPGAEDWIDYRNSIRNGGDLSADDAITKSGYDPYNTTVRFNLGTTYKITDALSLGLHGYNLLGAFNKDLNQRMIFIFSSTRNEPVAGTVTLDYKF